MKNTTETVHIECACCRGTGTYHAYRVGDVECLACHGAGGWDLPEDHDLVRHVREIEERNAR